MECAYYYNIMKIIDIILHNIDIINYYIMYLYMACTYLCIYVWRLHFRKHDRLPVDCAHDISYYYFNILKMLI